MTSKITNALVLECIDEMRKAKTKKETDKGLERKERKFQETVELQVALKDYDP